MDLLIYSSFKLIRNVSIINKMNVISPMITLNEVQIACKLQITLEENNINFLSSNFQSLDSSFVK